MNRELVQDLANHVLRLKDALEAHGVILIVVTEQGVGAFTEVCQHVNLSTLRKTILEHLDKLEAAGLQERGDPN